MLDLLEAATHPNACFAGQWGPASKEPIDRQADPSCHGIAAWPGQWQRTIFEPNAATRRNRKARVIRRIKDAYDEAVRVSKEQYERLSSMAAEPLAPAPANIAEEEKVVEALEVTPEFTLEVAERANERFLTRLDAVDAVLAGTLGGTFAIGAILVVNYSPALAPLAISFIVAIIAAVVGLVPNFFRLFSRRKKDGNLIDGDVDPGGAIGIFDARGVIGVRELAEEISNRWTRSQWQRRMKLWCAAIALAAISTGSIWTITQKVVVQSQHGSQGSPSQGQQAGRNPGTQEALPRVGGQEGSGRWPPWLRFRRSRDWVVPYGACFKAEVRCLPTSSPAPR